MPILSSVHCHSDYVDGKSCARDMIESAIARGFRSMGFTEHANQPIETKYGLTTENNIKYINEIKSLQKEYAGRIRVYLSIERDAMSSTPRDDYEYILGSSHYLVFGDDWAAADGDANRLIEIREKYFGGDGADMAGHFYKNYADYIYSFRPEAAAHFDIIRKNNKKFHLFDDNDPKVIRYENEALEKINAAGALLEVNTGSMARGYTDFPYPSQRILKFWKSIGGRITVGSDCHFAPHIAYWYDELPEYLAEAGFTTYWMLNPDKGELFVESKI